MSDLPASVRGFLDAVNTRDPQALRLTLTPDMTYHLIVPHPPVSGRDEVCAVMERVLGEADRVRWDVVSSGGAGDLVFVERVDRFWYGGREAAIECLGVIRLVDGLIAEIRDYADMATWKARKSAALG
jgi:limonene-1,2-epoxide hydrolase